MRTLTTADGRFLFRDVPRGRFSITASAPTHLHGGFGQLRPSGPAIRSSLPMAKRRAASRLRCGGWGRSRARSATNWANRSRGANVSCFRRVIAGGQKRYASQGAVLLTTDDRGMYRAASLAPGDYLCGSAQNTSTMPIAIVADDSVNGRAGGPPSAESLRLSNSGAGLSSPTGVRLGDSVFSSGAGTVRGVALPPPDANGRLMAFAPVYYPASHTSTHATVISLKAGEERTGVDLTLKLVPAVKVSGIVHVTVGFELVSQFAPRAGQRQRVCL